MSAAHGHPIACRDCGHELVLVCPKGHDSVEMSVAEQCGPDPISRIRAPRGPDSPPRKHRAPGTGRAPRIPKSGICSRCQEPFPRKSGQLGRTPKIGPCCAEIVASEAAARIAAQCERRRPGSYRPRSSHSKAIIAALFKRPSTAAELAQRLGEDLHTVEVFCSFLFKKGVLDRERDTSWKTHGQRFVYRAAAAA